MKYALLLLFATVCLVEHACADSIKNSFERLRSKKVKDHKLTSDIKGAICTRNGMDKSDFKSKVLRPGDKIKSKYYDYERTRGVCYNKHGPRCDSSFLKQKECYYQQIGGRCCLWSGGRPGYNKCEMYPLRTHKEISEYVCPYPCGCIFSGKPSRKSSAINKAQKLKVKGGGCHSKENWNQVKKYLDSWDVPKEAYDEFEMGTLMDRNDFVAFDYFMQPNKNEAKYGIAFGATRCHGDTIEFGYMFTGMWEVGTNAQKRCTSGGGRHSCHSTGISDEQVHLGRKTLEYYAWKNMEGTSFNSFDVAMEDSGNEDPFELKQPDGLFESFTPTAHKSQWKNNLKPYNNDLNRFGNDGLRWYDDDDLGRYDNDGLGRYDNDGLGWDDNDGLGWDDNDGWKFQKFKNYREQRQRFDVVREEEIKKKKMISEQYQKYQRKNIYEQYQKFYVPQRYDPVYDYDINNRNHKFHAFI